jgi:N-carbamoyl-L-amino-acid hydrolase
MDSHTEQLRINPARFQANFDALSEIGATGDGGVHRPALSEAHLAARAWFRDRIQKSELECRVDEVGNHSAYLPCGSEDGPTLLIGSHLDSVPYGGRFDGALGVLAAFEVLVVVKEAGISLPLNLEAIDFTDEEGTHLGLMGSAALAGKLTHADLEYPRGGKPAFVEGLNRAGLTEDGLLNAARHQGSLSGFLEVHIEQGARLINANAEIGVVTSIVGIGSSILTFIGRSDHAGTTSMEDRLDAAQGASAFILAIRDILHESFPQCVANVGKIDLKPGAFNIVPAEAILRLEYRAPETHTLHRLGQALIERARFEANRFGLDLEVEKLGEYAPSLMNDDVCSVIADAADSLGLNHIPLVSMAGHDAQSLAGLCPVGMFFVPSVGGASHSPREFTTWENCIHGANTLLQTTLRLALTNDQAG